MIRLNIGKVYFEDSLEIFLSIGLKDPDLPKLYTVLAFFFNNKIQHHGIGPISFSQLHLNLAKSPISKFQFKDLHMLPNLPCRVNIHFNFLGWVTLRLSKQKRSDRHRFLKKFDNAPGLLRLF